MKRKIQSLKAVFLFIYFFQWHINGEILKRNLAAHFHMYELLGYFHVILEVIYYYFHTNKKLEYSSKIHLLCCTVELNSALEMVTEFSFSVGTIPFTFLSEVRFFPSDN